MPMAAALTADANISDAQSYVRFLDAQPQTDKKKKMGVQGYCMGGPLTFRTAAIAPERIGAAATFHGGGLVSDKPDSPHLMIPKMKAEVLCAVADNDDKRDPAAKDKLRGFRSSSSQSHSGSIRRLQSRLDGAGQPGLQRGGSRASVARTARPV